jgi:hypothetical protein
MSLFRHRRHLSAVFIDFLSSAHALSRHLVPDLCPHVQLPLPHLWTCLFCVVRQAHGAAFVVIFGPSTGTYYPTFLPTACFS